MNILRTCNTGRPGASGVSPSDLTTVLTPRSRVPTSVKSHHLGFSSHGTSRSGNDFVSKPNSTRKGPETIRVGRTHTHTHTLPYQVLRTCYITCSPPFTTRSTQLRVTPFSDILCLIGVCYHMYMEYFERRDTVTAVTSPCDLASQLVCVSSE